MQHYDDDSAERITPHALTGDDREEYLDRLWAAFTEVATAGVIALQAAHNIVEDLSIDGEERFLELHVPKEKWQSLTFDDLVGFVDEMSRAASAEFQDAAEASREARINGIGEPTEGDGEENSIQSQIRRRLQVVLDVLSTPKILLIASTNAVMIVVCVALIIGLAVTWRHESNKWFNEHVKSVGAISSAAIGAIVSDMQREHDESKAHVTKLMSTWITSQMILSQQQTHEAGVTQRLRRVSSNVREVHATATRRTYESGYLGALSEINRRLDVAFEDAASNGTNSTNTTSAPLPQLLSTTIQQNFANQTSFRAAGCASAAVQAIREVEGGNASVNIVPFTNGSVCLIAVSSATLHPHAMTAVQAINKKMPVQFGYITVFTLNAATGAFELAPETTPPLGCLDENMVNYCSTMAATIQTEPQMQTHRGVPFLHNNSYYISLAKVIDGKVYLGLGISTQTKQEQLQKELVDLANTANDPTSVIAKTLGWRLDIGIRNLTSGEIIPRASAPPSADCSISCDLPELTRNVILRSFENGTAAADATNWLPGANYEPESVTHCYSEGGDTGVEFVTYLSAPRLADKQQMFGRLAGAINRINKADIGTFEAIAVGLVDQPPLETFDAFEPCPEGVHCIVDESSPIGSPNNKGVLYRYDCRDCQRLTVSELHLGEAVLLTDPHSLGRSYANEGCTSRQCMLPLPDRRGLLVAHDHSGASSSGQAKNYAGDTIMYIRDYFPEWSVLVEAHVRRSELTAPVYKFLGIAVGISVVVLLLGIASLWFFANRNFDIIERDWAFFKRQIQREKDRFAGLVKGFIPPHIVDRMVGGHRVLVDQTQGSTFTFIDVCAFSNESKTWQPKHVSRYLAYCFFVMEEVSTVHSVMKLRTIGDLFCAVASRLERSAKDAREDPSQHPVRRSMDMAATLMLLFSPSYEHYPQNSRNFRDIFKERQQDGRPTSMPVLRIGMHLGPAVGGAFSVGNTSHFDFFGPGPALANRMQLTALPGRIHVTSVVREALKARDPEHCYTFDASRKTIVRGQGTIASYFVKSVLISAPTSLTEPMGIRPATKRVDFTVTKKKGTDSNASEQSEAGAV